MILIIDYDMGNPGSIYNMVKRVGGDAVVSSEYNDVLKAEKIILPGVGSFDDGIANLEKLNLAEALTKRVLTDKIPVLGICLGMQLMTKSSEEGVKKGLSWVNAETVKFDKGAFKSNSLKIPHMGWSRVKILKPSAVFKNFSEPPKFYFVHSYHAACSDRALPAAEAEYGYPFTAAFQKENIFGTQFHPEKSHRFGMRLIKNFMEL